MIVQSADELVLENYSPCLYSGDTGFDTNDFIYFDQ